MATVRRELQFSRLPSQVRRRFTECLAGRGMPRPVWQSIDPPEERWKVMLIAGGLLTVVLALLGGDSPQGWPWIVVWAIASVLLAWGVIGWLRNRKLAASLPFASGTHLFATELVEVQEGVCSIYDLEALADLRVKPVHRPGGAPETELQFVFPGKVVGKRMAGRQSAERVVNDFWSAREALSAAMSTAQWDQVAALDPLYEARYGGAWEQLQRVPVSALQAGAGSKKPFGLHPSVVRGGLLAGCVIAPLLWFGSNFVRDELAFSRARSVHTVAGWRSYIGRGNGRHRNEVRDRYLPEAALEAAKQTGTASALREFLQRYGTSTAAPTARALLHMEYERAISSARGEMAANAAEAFSHLLAWLEENQTSAVDVRFGASSQALLANFDDLVALLQQEFRTKRSGVEFAPIAPAFSNKAVAQREEALINLLRQGLEPMIPPSLLTLQRGGAFSGAAIGFDRPAFAIEWVANPAIEEGKPVQPRIDVENGTVYLPLAFDFKVSLAVPKQKTFTFAFSFLPANYLPETFTGRSLYDRMVEMAFEELQQRIAATYFPKHAPERSFRLTKVVPRSGAARPVAAQPAGPRAGATGFCISPAGYVVTAHHFTAAVQSFKVVTKSGRLDAELVRDDPANDISILKIKGTLPALPIRASSSVKLGEGVATIGFPNTTIQGTEPKFTTGEVSSLAGMRDDPRMFQVSVPVQPGNSGGPLVDLSGNVIGVISSRLDFAGGNIPQNVNYAVKSSYLLSLLEAVSGVGQLPSPVPGGTTKSEELAERVQQATVLIEGY